MKVLHERFVGDVDVEGHFREEAFMANRVRSPNVLPVLDTGLDERSCAFLVMPLLEGETLRTCAARLGGTLPIGEVVAVALAVLDALAAVHETDVVHCDVKPENVFVTKEGDVRLLDFGIAQPSGDDAAAESPAGARSPRVLGTPGFMAPEQVRRSPARVDARTDVWGAGALMFALLVGRPVHASSTTRATLARTSAHPPPPLASVAPGVDRALAAVVDRALQRAPGARWKDARSMADALRRAAGDMAQPTLTIEENTQAQDRASEARAANDVVEPTLRLATTRTAAIEEPARYRRPRWLVATVAAVGLAWACGVASSRSRTPTAPVVAVVASR